MKNVLFVLFLSFVATSFSTQEDFCLKPEERKLYNLLMNYRKQKGLAAIPLSTSLTKVAKLHVHDLSTNNSTSTKCNMHSWSKSGNWSACCYTDNHKEAQCMWDKPRELSAYTGDGFEIAAQLIGDATAEKAMDGWKNSPGHNQVMINLGSWKKTPWQAVGIGIEGKYAVIWFGMEADPEKVLLEDCE